MERASRTQRVLPLLGVVALIALPTLPPGIRLYLGALALVLSVLAAVHHAEVVAHRVGEPYGTLVLAVSITVIEAGLIVTLMLAADGAKPTLARDAIHAALMIICTGVVGLCLLVGSLWHGVQSYRTEGATTAFAALVVLGVLVLILPPFTTSAPGASYTEGQLVFVALASFLLWATFVGVQTGRHRDYFLPEAEGDERTHATPPTARRAWGSFALLLVALVAVVGLAKALSPSIGEALLAVGAPAPVLGIVVALLVLLPEGTAAVRAARARRIQTSMNLALGSAMATIGLTIPVVVVLAVVLDLPIALGLGSKDMVLLAATFGVCGLSFGFGRTNLLLAAVHLVLFASFLFLALVP